VGEEIFLEERQVACLGMWELGVVTVGLGLHNREVWFSNQMSQVNVHDGSTMIAWAEREWTERYGSCLKVGRYLHPINWRFAHPVALLEGDWWEECRVGREDGLLEAKVNTEGRNLCFPNVTIHVSHKNDLIAIQLPGGESSTKVTEECSPG